VKFVFIHECTNRINDQDCKTLSEYIINLKNLKVLTLLLRLNKVNDGIKFISNSIKDLQKLESITF
jgi:hypothetical protein